MCDQNLLGFLLVAAEVALVAACAMLFVAISAGGSIFTAFQSMALSLTTTIFIAAANASLLIARFAVLPACMGGACGGAATTLATALSVAIGMLTATLIALAVCTFIPGAVSVAGPLALVTLLGVAGSFVFLGVALGGFVTCLGAGTVSAWLTIATLGAYFAATVAAAVAIYGIVVTIQAAASG